MKYFQYQVLHSSLITNKKLHEFNLRDHDTCDNCNEIETIRQLLVECDSIKKLWQHIGEWRRQKIKAKINTDTLSILLGHRDDTYLINYITIVVKHEIYKGKRNQYIPTI